MERNISFSTPAVQYGLIAGVVYALGLVILYLLGDYYFIGTFAMFFSFRMIPFFIAAAIAVYAGSAQKKLNGGYISFANAFLTVLLAMLISEAFFILTMWLLYNVVDPDLAMRGKEMTLAKIEETYYSLGMDEEQIDEAMQIVESQDFSYGLKTILLGALFSAIISAVIALITAAIIKKEKPETYVSEAEPIDAN